MVAYVVVAPNDPERREHVTTLWCASCGALGTRRYNAKQYGNLTTWCLPTKTKGPSRRKSPVPTTHPADPLATGKKKAATKKRGRLAPI